MSAFTQAGLLLLAPSCKEDVKTIFIYVDGGYLPIPTDNTLAQCSWELCVITDHVDGTQVPQGCVGGWVSANSADPVSVGARELNSFSVEIQAHLFARLLLAQSSFCSGGQGCPNWVRQYVSG